MILEEETDVPEQQCNTNTTLQTQMQRISTTHFMFSFASCVTLQFQYMERMSVSFPCSSGYERPGNEARGLLFGRTSFKLSGHCASFGEYCKPRLDIKL